MFKYTLAFIKRKNELLMLNRNKSPWMGSWNGVGGKLDPNEEPLDCIIREIKEETNLIVTKKDIEFKGYVTWNTDFSPDSGLYVYVVNLDDDFIYPTPLNTVEGILDWKKISWVSDFENYGVSHNIPYFIQDVLYNEECYNHYCKFDGKILVSVTKEKL